MCKPLTMCGVGLSRIKIFENLRALTGAPSVQMSEVPPSFMIREEDEDAQDPDVRTENDGKRQHDAEFYRDDKVRAVCWHDPRHLTQTDAVALCRLHATGSARQ